MGKEVIEAPVFEKWWIRRSRMDPPDQKLHPSKPVHPRDKLLGVYRWRKAKAVSKEWRRPLQMPNYWDVIGQGLRSPLSGGCARMG